MRKVHVMRAGHRVTLCGRWPSSKCKAVELAQVDWAEPQYCRSCSSASLRTTDLEALRSNRQEVTDGFVVLEAIAFAGPKENEE